MAVNLNKGFEVIAFIKQGYAISKGTNSAQANSLICFLTQQISGICFFDDYTLFIERFKM